MILKDKIWHFGKVNRKVKLVFLISCVLLFTVVIVANQIIVSSTNSYLFSEVDSIPYSKVGLLLGTSKYLKSGKPNLYFHYRIDATEQLFKAHKIDFLVISGDNSIKDYNEPQDMKNELIKRGIQANKIFLDFAGFRTLDSVYRMREIFGQSTFTIISQKFHNQRATYIANKLGLKTIAFNAKDVSLYTGFKTQLREYFARVKAVLDMLTNKKPKFLGEKIIIE